MFFSESDVTEFIEDNDVKFIRLTFCDTLGAMKNIAILPRELPRAIAYGIPFNATGLLEEQHQNLLLKPECTTLSVLPWRPQSGRVVRFFCNLMTMDGKPYAGDLRQNLRNTMREIEENDYQCQIATRCEFYLFKTDVEGNPTREPYDQGGYLDIAPLDKCENTRREICLSLEEMGLNPTSSCHKHGPGQNEIDFACSNCENDCSPERLVCIVHAETAAKSERQCLKNQYHCPQAWGKYFRLMSRGYDTGREVLYCRNPEPDLRFYAVCKSNRKFLRTPATAHRTGTGQLVI